MRGQGRTVLLVVLDGVADRPAPGLDGRTPLEAAATPHLDRLAADGVSGLVDVSEPGTPLSSDRAHAILFGYRTGEVPGRGVLEARGFDIEVPEGAVACSASFARVEETGPGGTDASGKNGETDADEPDGWTITDRTVADARDACGSLAGRVAEFTHAGGEDANASGTGAGAAEPSVDVRFTYTWKNRGIVTLESDGDLSPAVTDVDPFEAGLPVAKPTALADAPDEAAAVRTADALAAYTRWSVDRLADAPVDVVLSKWAGTPTDPPSFEDRHGMAARLLTPKPVLQGLGETLGMTVEDAGGPYAERVERTLAAVDDEAFVHLHLPEPDEVAHADPPAAKRDEVETIDAALEPLVDRALEDSELVVAVTADHTTPSRGNVVHSGEPVPLVLHGETVRTDDVATVGERPAAKGGLHRLRGRDVARLLRARADRVLLDGLRRGPDVPDYPTSDVTPLERDP